MTSSARDNASAPSNQADQPAAVIELKDAWLRLRSRSGTTDILKGINLAIPGGQHVAWSARQGQAKPAC